jgi:hypothetical protein
MQKQVRRCVKSLEQAQQRRDPNLAYAPLDARHLYSRKPGSVRQIFLGPALRLSCRPDVFAKPLDRSIHGPDRLGR